MEAPVSLPTAADVEAAARRLAGVALHTPLLTSAALDAMTGGRVFLKAETLQHTGSFKFRGAYNKLAAIPAEQRAGGVVAFSSGNHAQGVALAAKLLNIPAAIVMPNDAPPVKLAATRGYGAEVIVYDRLKESREAIAKNLAAERGVTLVPPFNDPHIIAGQGTAALELLEEIPDLDILVTPVGGGGLISGCAIAAKALRPSIQVIGVEAVGADDAKQSLARGEIVHIDPPDTIADGIRTQAIGALTFPIMRELLSDIVLVSDDEIIQALRFVFARMKIVVEPTGAVPIAAVMQNKIPANLKRVGVIVSGGNIDFKLLSALE
jgi:threo-3-hydroxy-L-aspartate ammonia-lyase